MNLPPLWNVLYDEALRGNHLLFEGMEREEAGSPDEDLGAIIVDLVSLNELSEMVEYINELSFEQKRNLFALYLRSVHEWSFEVRMAAN